MQAIFLVKAKSSIQAAQVLFDQHLYDDSANRAYYAAFQAARAALSGLAFRQQEPDIKPYKRILIAS